MKLPLHLRPFHTADDLRLLIAVGNTGLVEQPCALLGV